MKNKSFWLWFPPVIIVLLLAGLLFIDPVREYLFAILFDTYLFIKKNIIAILTAFFLIKGKFVIKAFLRKILLLSATGLGKRYMIERVLNHQIKVHFLDHLQDDFKRLLAHVKYNFKNFPPVKKFMTAFAFLGSLGFVGKFMGGMLAVKVFIAKIWSFLLAIFLKVFSAFFYFLTNVVWGSWVAPIVEVVFFSWILNWLEKIPFFNTVIKKLYTLFQYLFGWLESLIAKLMKAPLRRFLKWMVKTMKIAIYKFIGYGRVSLYGRLKERRELNLNAWERVGERRKTRPIQRRTHLSAREKLKQKREKRKVLNKTCFS